MQVDEDYYSMSRPQIEQDNYYYLIHQSMQSKQKKEKLAYSQIELFVLDNAYT